MATYFRKLSMQRDSVHGELRRVLVVATEGQAPCWFMRLSRRKRTVGLICGGGGEQLSSPQQCSTAHQRLCRRTDAGNRSYPVKCPATARWIALGKDLRRCHPLVTQNMDAAGLPSEGCVGDCTRVQTSMRRLATYRRTALGAGLQLFHPLATPRRMPLISLQRCSMFDCESEALSAKVDACNGVYTAEASCDSQAGCPWYRWQRIGKEQS